MTLQRAAQAYTYITLSPISGAMAAVPPIAPQSPALANGSVHQGKPSRPTQPKVVLLHGLLRTADCMRKLER
jgi:hypothetical protein